MSAQNTAGNDVAVVNITDDMLKGIASFKDAIKLANDLAAKSGGVVEQIADYGTGFRVANKKDKAKLVDVPFIVLEWSEHKGDHARTLDDGTVIDTFVSAVIVTENDDKLILNDGGTGIAAQLRDVTASRITAGHPTPAALLAVPGGLRESSYWRNKVSGDIANKVPDGAKSSDWEPGTTYYLA